MDKFDSSAPAYFSSLAGPVDEPRFVIGAGDPAFDIFVRTWADDRTAAISAGKAPLSDVETVVAAKVMLVQAEAWRARQAAKATEKLPAASYDIPPVAADVPKPTQPILSAPPPPVPVVKAKPAKPASKLEKAVVGEAAAKSLKSPGKTQGTQRVKLAK